MTYGVDLGNQAMNLLEMYPSMLRTPMPLVMQALSSADG